jgi:membrane-associated protein
MNIFARLVDFIVHIDTYIINIVNSFGAFSYLILGLIIFIETGLVFVPFIPGDSILFVVGLLSAQGSLNIWLITIILMVAAITGDTCNYVIGHYFGAKLLKKEKIVKYLGKHIQTTKEFFDKHGGLGIIYARFVPIVRTIAPFLAGLSNMKYEKFVSYNIIGGIAWVLSVTVAGYFLGNVSFVKEHLTIIIFSIIFISIIPIIIALIKSKKGKKNHE